MNKKILKRLDVPPLHYGCEVEKIPDKCNHKEFIVNKIKPRLPHLIKNGTSLYLSGKYSTGKSGLAVALLKDAFEYNIFGLYVMCGDVPGFYINKTVFDADQTYAARMENVDLLVLDELIPFQGNTYKNDCIENLVKKRINNLKTTIITSNISFKDLYEEFPSLHQSLKECTVPITLSGHDFREDKKENLKNQLK